MSELHQDVAFHFSQGWFDRFKARNDISYRWATNVAQQKPADHEEKVRNFHQEIRRVAASAATEFEGQLGQFRVSTIANVDQTPLPFTFNKGQGYDAKTVWHHGAQSGLDKRQCTVQLTIFADGEPRVKPLLIFRGKGLGISQTEKRSTTTVLRSNSRKMPGAMKTWCTIGFPICGDDLSPQKHKSQSSSLLMCTEHRRLQQLWIS